MSKGALTAAQAETYYEEKYSHDDYYSEKHRVVGQWFGHGAEELGLSAGDIASEDFRPVLRGLHPASGEILVHKANGYDDRRAGWDATFNAPKSVSIQGLVGGDDGLIEAHRKAVSRALEELEYYALSRRRGGSEWVVTGNIVAARFDHVAARPASSVEDGYGPDHHLHTHVVLANMTRRPDGEWRGLDPVEIYRAQNFATAVYRSELAREVRQRGYEIRVAGHDGRWELDGYTREQVIAFSRRRDIEPEAGVRARTVASLLQSESTETRAKQIWIIDESSLLPTSQVNRLSHKAREQGVERVVFVGDQHQHHAIEAGRPVFQMQQAGMPVGRLDHIRRQRDRELREAVMHAAKGEVAESLRDSRTPRRYSRGQRH
jgi:conjugative relaxase-like TrwC/TraI family protein